MGNEFDMPPAQVREILARHYGVTADRIDVVSGEFATVCRVAGGPRPLAVKAMPAAGTEPRLVRWQTEAMIRLAEQGLPVPAVHLTVDGQPVVESDTALVQVTDWLTDPPLSDIPVDPPLLRAVGETAARVSVALEGLTPPAPTGHDWELIRAGDTLRGALGTVPDRNVAAALAVFERDLRPLFDRLPWTVVHHDLHDSNLLVGRDGQGRRGITGILDFGDLTYGPRLAELAVAAAYAARNTADPHAAVLEVAAGWTGVLPLTAEERRGLFPAVVTRLATNVAVWAARATGPRADYAAARASGSVDALEALLQRRRERSR